MLDLPEYNEVVKTFVTSDVVKGVVDLLNEEGASLQLSNAAAGFKYIVDYVRAGHKVLIGGEDSFHNGVPSILKLTWDDGIGGAFLALIIKSMLEDVPDLQEKTLKGYVAYIERKIPAYAKVSADTKRTGDFDEDNKMISAGKTLIAKTYKQIDAGVEMVNLDIIRKVEELAQQEFEAQGLPVPKIERIQIEYQGPDSRIPPVRDGIQIIFDSGDRIVWRPSGTEPMMKGYVDAKNPGNYKLLVAVIGGLNSWAKAEYEAGRSSESSAMLVTNDDEDSPLQGPKQHELGQSTLDQLEEILGQVVQSNPQIKRFGLIYSFGENQRSEYVLSQSGVSVARQIVDRLKDDGIDPSRQLAVSYEEGLFVGDPKRPTIVFHIKDAAMGGIDLASKHLNMESSGEKVNITFDPAMIAQFERGDFSGVRIQILDVVPINLMPLLGLKEDEMAGQLAKA